jgi:hypothetical protein
MAKASHAEVLSGLVFRDTRQQAGKVFDPRVVILPKQQVDCGVRIDFAVVHREHASASVVIERNYVYRLAMFALKTLQVRYCNRILHAMQVFPFKELIVLLRI